MLDTICFVIFLIVISIYLEIKTRVRRRYIVASSGLYVIVLYYFLFELFKDQFTLKLLVQIRLDIWINTIEPFIMKLLTYNPFESDLFYGGMEINS